MANKWLNKQLTYFAVHLKRVTFLPVTCIAWSHTVVIWDDSGDEFAVDGGQMVSPTHV